MIALSFASKNVQEPVEFGFDLDATYKLFDGL